MTERMNVPTTLYELAKAIGRDENVGGADKTASNPNPDHDIQAREERVLRCLGAAVILQWNDLPTEIQHHLFEDAASMTDTDRRFRLKQHIARFLHEHKDDE